MMMYIVFANISFWNVLIYSNGNINNKIEEKFENSSGLFQLRDGTFLDNIPLFESEKVSSEEREYIKEKWGKNTSEEDKSLSIFSSEWSEKIINIGNFHEGHKSASINNEECDFKGRKTYKSL
jgi:hypothetical protein